MPLFEAVGLHKRFGDLEVFTCGAWCQGPSLLQALTLLKGFDLPSMGHNSTRYVHTVVEALKLSLADRRAEFVADVQKALFVDGHATDPGRENRVEDRFPLRRWHAGTVQVEHADTAVKLAGTPETSGKQPVCRVAPFAEKPA